VQICLVGVQVKQSACAALRGRKRSGSLSTLHSFLPFLSAAANLSMALTKTSNARVGKNLWLTSKTNLPNIRHSVSTAKERERQKQESIKRFTEEPKTFVAQDAVAEVTQQRRHWLMSIWRRFVDFNTHCDRFRCIY
jgi:hypothetical protein